MEKRDRFNDLLARQRRRFCFQFGDDIAYPREHRLPVLDADANLGENVVERMHDRGALCRIIGLIDMEMDEAFAARVGRVRSLELDKPARSVTPYQEYR